MTGTEMKTAANSFVGSALTDADTVTAIKEFIDKIGALAQGNGTITVAMVAYTWYDLPDDAIEVEKLEDSQHRQYIGYEKKGQRIRVYTSGTYEIYCTKLPAVYSDISQGPAIRLVFHPACLEYVKAYAMLKVNPNSRAGEKAKEEAIGLAHKAAKDISKQGPARMKVIRRG
jgi:hypothetical protein